MYGFLTGNNQEDMAENVSSGMMGFGGPMAIGGAGLMSFLKSLLRPNSPEGIVRRGGGKFVGMQETDVPGEMLTLFHDPRRNAMLALPFRGLTKEAVLKHIEESRKLFDKGGLFKKYFGGGSQ